MLLFKQEAISSLRLLVDRRGIGLHSIISTSCSLLLALVSSILQALS